MPETEADLVPTTDAVLVFGREELVLVFGTTEVLVLVAVEEVLVLATTVVDLVPVADADLVLEVLVDEVLVDVLVEDLVEETTAPPGLYQLASGSPMHSPKGIDFNPLVSRKSRIAGMTVLTVTGSGSWLSEMEPPVP